MVVGFFTMDVRILIGCRFTFELPLRLVLTWKVSVLHQDPLGGSLVRSFAQPEFWANW